MSTPKTELRRRLRRQRADLSEQEQSAAARRLAIHLGASRWFRSSDQVACYLANDGEIDPWPVIERCWQLGKTCYLPVVSHLSWDHLWYAPFEPDTPLVVNRYGVPEPEVDRRHWCRAQSLGLILLPLVAFDTDGNRLGMGAGFYDRSLAFLHRRRYWRRPHLLGLAHDFQRVDALPVEEWDVPLQGVVTDRGFYPGRDRD